MLWWLSELDCRPSFGRFECTSTVPESSTGKSPKSRSVSQIWSGIQRRCSSTLGKWMHTIEKNAERMWGKDTYHFLSKIFLRWGSDFWRIKKFVFFEYIFLTISMKIFLRFPILYPHNLTLKLMCTSMFALNRRISSVVLNDFHAWVERFFFIIFPLFICNPSFKTWNLGLEFIVRIQGKF